MKPMYISLILVFFLRTSSITFPIELLHSYSKQSKVVDLKEYEGTYTFQDGSPLQKFFISVKDNDLYGEADAHGANKLLKQAEDDTYKSTSSYGSTIIFTRDVTTKKVNGLKLIIQGTTLEATRDKS